MRQGCVYTALFFCPDVLLMYGQQAIVLRLTMETQLAAIVFGKNTSDNVF
jgi:hypothetical protein